MTIRTIEAGVPTSFPPARLFLDDIEQIVRVLIEATENNHRARKEDDAETKVTLKIGDQVCDEIDELPKIAAKTTQLDINVTKGRWAESSLNFDRDYNQLSCITFARSERLSLYNKLSPIFKRRNRWLATLLDSHPPLYGALAISLYLWFLITLLLMLNKKLTPAWAIVIGLPPLAAIVSAWATGSLHGIIILRRSTEPSPLRQELLQRAPLAAISSVLTFLLTLLGFYLKHKYWP